MTEEISIFLKEAGFVKVLRNLKKCVDHRIISYDQANELLKEGFNVGLMGGVNGFIPLDADTPEFADYVRKNAPPTYEEKTIRGGSHFIFVVLDKDGLKNRTFPDGELRAEGQYVVVAPSKAKDEKHDITEPRPYTITQNVPVAEITAERLNALISGYQKEKKTAPQPTPQPQQKEIDISKSGDEWRFLKELLRKGLTDDEINQRMQTFSKWTEAPQKYRDRTLKKANESVRVENSRKEVRREARVFGRKGQAGEFYKAQPFFYDKNKLFWLWNEDRFCYEYCDDTDLLVGIEKELRVDTISTRERVEILTALQQHGRRNIPEPIPKSWVQFNDKVVDIKTGRKITANPKYFLTNPLPFSLGDSTETPAIDKLFHDWVDEEYVRTLHEIIAYACISDRFLQRIVALVGGGSNGKGSYIKLVEKLLGKNNVVSSELSTLSTNRFETFYLYKKLLCSVGEVGETDLKNTSQIKKLSGEDTMRYECKQKTPFSDTNTALIVASTNSLPATRDRTLGFYRRFLIVDFPHQFTIKNDLLDTIPAYEFGNLAQKCVHILRELYEKQKFTNEGSFEDRMEKYEERSNPVIRFLESHYEEEPSCFVKLSDFVKAYNEYAKEKHFKQRSAIEIGKSLRAEGYSLGPRKYRNGDSANSLLNFKTIQTNDTKENKTYSLYGINSNSSSLSSLSSRLVKDGWVLDTGVRKT